MPLRKTAKGQAEIETRAHRLTPRLRGLLILVDGKRDTAALASLVPQQCDALLAELIKQGFIDEPPPPPTPAPAPSPAPATAPAAPTAAVAPTVNFETLRRSAVRALNDEVGPAADALAMRMERAHNIEELRPLLALAAQLVASMRGRPAGEVYGMRFLASLNAL